MSGPEKTSTGKGGEEDRGRDPGTLFAELIAGVGSLGDAGLASLGFPTAASSAQWQAALRGLAGWASLPTVHLERIVGDIGARRKQVQLLRDQLTAFDEQLGTLETTLRPLLEWNRLWSETQRPLLGRTDDHDPGRT